MLALGAQLIGALVPTFIVSRLLLWAMRSWDGGVTRLLVANGGSWLVAAFLGGLGMADGGAFAGLQAAALYFVPQTLWFGLDVWRMPATDEASPST